MTVKVRFIADFPPSRFQMGQPTNNVGMLKILVAERSFKAPLQASGKYLYLYPYSPSRENLDSGSDSESESDTEDKATITETKKHNSFYNKPHDSLNIDQSKLCELSIGYQVKLIAGSSKSLETSYDEEGKPYHKIEYNTVLQLCEVHLDNNCLAQLDIDGSELTIRVSISQDLVCTTSFEIRDVAEEDRRADLMSPSPS